MEAVIEKECSALGGLFQTIISDMKVGRRGRGCGGLRALTSPPRFASSLGQRLAGPCLRRGRPPPAGARRPECHLLTRGSARGSAGSSGWWLLWGCLMSPAISPLIVPGDGTVSFPWGLRAPADWAASGGRVASPADGLYQLDVAMKAACVGELKVCV
ncbi:Metastasis suppressor protein 1 [Tupaia chinensis]|uniref:Metastasis suppressor protein 1 n=1 Tax=Tupaia chinensis TaxID=246437 RepID=L9KUI0_TUPCH|nr:Metastasis suppressor protein 1 [Tupaia chinensis]